MAGKNMRHMVKSALFGLGLAAAAFVMPGQASAADNKVCVGCHDQVKEFHARGKHSKLSCTNCHDKTDAHLKDASVKPVTRTDHAVCGGCHKEQYESFGVLNLASKAKVEKASFKSRSPLFDKLIAGHGFSKEHDEPRSHGFMLVDHLIVDRAYGGRFQLDSWKDITNAKDAVKDAWLVVKDKEPSTSDQKPFIAQGAMAANSVCLNCKTQDHILKWKYMGDPDPNAAWSRTSKPVEFVRDLKHALNCFMCHDPHSTEPRVVRDALIDAVVVRGKGTYPYDAKKSAEVTMQKVDFRGFRSIGILNKPDSNLMCAQCHVEYNCNPGTNPATGEKIGMDSRLTNFFPWSNVMDLQAVYKEAGFKDFKHATTGALLTKLQHPEAETFWGSAHERAGVECKDCHMPRVKKGNKTYTDHGQRSARYMKKETCVKCHPTWSAEEAEYQIDSIQNYTKGKITKAEFWLGALIDKTYEAKQAGVPDEALAKAREAHDSAHILWEWWTAENSDGFHNPAMARESLTKSITISQDAIKALDEAIAAKKAK
ncbi:MAG: ammonia-forming cytochrome c nitrite reductase subunit c552 [Nitrospirae bacterium]|nr:ammonia-forming cytochrome c nitrite reductase subunit c552 [Nitrospirota bacterium]